METKIYCHNPACQQKLVVDESYFGRAFTCPVCGMVLQIPFPTQPLPQKKSSAAVLPQVEAPVSFRNRIGRLLVGWSVSVVLFLLLIFGIHVYQQVLRSSLPGDLDGIVKEVMASANILNIAPVSNNKENLLLYVRDMGANVGIFLANMTTLDRKQIEAVPSEKIPPRLIGWSPDDQYLVFATTSKKNQINQHIMIRDGASGALVSAFDLPDSLERGAWLSTNSLVLSVRHKLYLFNFEKDYDNLGHYGDKGLSQLQFNSTVVPSSLVPIDGRAIAYDDGHNVWFLNIANCRLTQLTHLTNATIGQLDYNSDNKSFLFSLAISGKGADPCLYRFDPRTNSPTSGLAQFTDRYNFERIYYGNWLADGTGLAYAGQNFIGVTVKGGAFHTNLFSEGYYRNFSISPQGDKVFALASVANEPLAIWAYDINYGDLDDVVPPKEHLKFSQWADPTKVEIVQKNGRRLGYSVLNPPDQSVGKKYPVVLNLLGNNPYDVWPQILANVGVISVTIRPQSPDDIKAIVENLLERSNVDPRRFYIVGQGADVAMIRNILNQNAKFWRGVILLWPSEFSQLLRKPSPSPPFLILGGANRNLIYELKAERFVQSACQKLVPVQLLFDDDIMRLSPKADLNQERYKIMVKFILTGDLN